MAFTISPSVNFTETDATLTTVQIADGIGAIAITANWGPVDEPVLITQGESELVSKYSKPSAGTDGINMLCAIDFLSYSSKILVNRGVGANAKNAVPTNSTPLLVKNANDYEDATLNGIDFLGRYPGAKANGIVIDIIDKANFDAWEYKNNFDYKPSTGEYAVAVIDGAGTWSGKGSSYQTENLSFSGKVSGGIREVARLAFTGTSVTGGIKQQETLTVVGTATGNGNISVNGTNVAVVTGDTATIVAGKIADALALVTATYDSAVDVGANVTVVFKTPGAQTKIADVTALGITVTSVIDIVGSDDVVLSIFGQNVNVKYGDNPTQVVAKAQPVLAANTAVFYSAAINADPTKLDVTFAEYGAQASYGPVTANGITQTNTVVTPGSSVVTLSIWGHNVVVANKDSAATVASAFAVVLNGLNLYDGVTAQGNNVLYTYRTIGAKTKQATPANQSGISFNVSILTYGTKGTLLEKYELLSNDVNAKFPDGSSKYFVDVINRRSNYLWVGDTSIPLSYRSITLQGGVDDNNANLTSNINAFSNSETYDVNYVIAGAVDAAVQKIVVDVAETRRDCIAFVSPRMEDVIGNPGNELTAVLDWRTNDLNRESSYLFSDSGWAKVYDSYNDVYRWIPTCGGTAGLKARTDADFNQWTSPAGHARGRYKRYAKLAWSPSKGQRDELYKVGVNPVVNFPGDGIMLFGDKMTFSRPSAFDHINVRSAFIVAEKSIANLSRFFLFEVNDEFTRNQFLNAVRPFLRNMQAARAFEDFRVICDERNNNAQVRTENKMIGTIMIKPLYSINYIRLDFIAVRPDVSFDEIAGELL